ncbi:MAG: hypothetical protein RBG13Loki_2185 [Promethearchaeota archaeon CR_4]|nr:MAG: hypothetical protein RBG13Loki_2185 [Candidatus Lokiarchaeota archaeon CR_4]
MEKRTPAKLAILVTLAIWTTCVPLSLLAIQSTSGGGSNVVNAKFNTSGCTGLTLLNTLSEDHYADGRDVWYNSGTPSPRPAVPLTPPLGTGEVLVVPAQQVAALPGNSYGAWWTTTYDFTSNGTTYDSPLPIMASESGDFFGDNHDELVVIYSNCTAIMYADPYNNSHQVWTHQFTGRQYLQGIKMVKGDFGGNGTDELVVLIMWITLTGMPFTFYEYAQWEVYDVKNDARVNIWQHSMQRNVISGDEYTGGGNIVAGDLDGDQRDELVVEYDSCRYMWVYEYDEAQAGYTLLSDSTNPANFLGENIYGTEMVAGDLDGDRREEIIAMPQNRMYESSCAIFAWSLQFNLLQRTSPSIPIPYWWAKFLVVGDFTGSGLGNLAVLGGYGGPHGDEGGYLLVFDDSPHNDVPILYVPFESNNYLTKAGLAAADVDCDGLDEMYVVGTNGLTILDDASKNFTILYQNVTLAQNYGNEIQADLMPDSQIVPGNYDGSGIVLQYTGEHSSFSTPPGIMVALAAPPYYAGVEANNAFAFTQYGMSASESASESSSVGTSSGWGMSVEAKFEFGGALGWHGGFGAKFGYECEEEFARTNTVTRSTSYATKYAIGTSDNGIIFQITTFDQYKYEIVAHPNATWIGTYMNIQIPQPPLLYKTTVNYFNRAFPNAPQIGSETFTHTIGQPWTYIDPVQVNAIAPHRWQSDTQTIGLGDGTNAVEIEVANESSTEVSRSWISKYSVGASAEVGYGFFTVSIEGHYSWGSSSERNFQTTVGDAVTFEGVVGDMKNANDFARLNFTFALFAYNLQRVGGNVSYLVLNYCVAGATPYVPLIPAYVWASVLPIMIFGATAAVPVLSVVVSKRKGKR